MDAWYMHGMEWVELSLTAGPLAEEIAALLVSTEDAAGAGVEIRGEEIVCWAPAAEADAAAAALDAAAARLREQGFELGPVRKKPAPPESEWRDGWKRFFHVHRIGERIVIVPSWETYAAQPGDVVLDLDPGRAFGTGLHQSTKLCLMAAERLTDRPVKRFLDVGCGSGILSIAAAKLWPDSTGIAVDNDPIAVSAASENCALNRVPVEARETLPQGGLFELVFANIQADVLESLRDAILARLAPGGALVLSGLLTPQAEPVAAHYGLPVGRIDHLDDWSSVVLTKPA
jgi:ribosomal protein L11 methyltransferase